MVFSGCAERSVDNVIRVDVDADATAEIVPRVEVSKVIALAGDVPVGEVRKTIARGGRYYLLSKTDNAIVCFDGDGGFVFRIAADGRGPQEYSGLTNFFIDETDGELKVLAMNGDIVSFSPDDGRFVGRESTGYMMLNDGFAIDDRMTALSIMGPEWNVEIRRAGVAEFHLPFNEMRDFVISKKMFARHGREVFHVYGQDDNIYVLPSEAGAEPRVAYAVDFGPARVAPELYADGSGAAVMGRQEAADFASKIDDLGVTRDHVAFSYLFFGVDGSMATRNVIYDRRGGVAYNFLRGDFYLLPVADAFDGGFFSVVHPVRILDADAAVGSGAAQIPDVTRALQAAGVVEDDNPVVVHWKLK
ncbi:MAG: 6-bladed beta-propeller [Alistipes sp.]|jgi:hypothetical protein|nr:6-bladed beta-propeller [Alistipes sp.]